jgi:hypothetical protein
VPASGQRRRPHPRLVARSGKLWRSNLKSKTCGYLVLPRPPQRRRRRKKSWLRSQPHELRNLPELRQYRQGLRPHPARQRSTARPHPAHLLPHQRHAPDQRARHPLKRRQPLARLPPEQRRHLLSPPILYEIHGQGREAPQSFLHQ